MANRDVLQTTVENVISRVCEQWDPVTKWFEEFSTMD